ncbi:DMT family transporter [Donghicola mangrovi]|nr:DMT family transporter [Donghicola mangrovi]
MMPLAVFGLLVMAGAALVVQNLLMTGIMERASSVLVPLVMNSAVGLVLLSGLLLWQLGPQGVKEAAGTLRPVALIPGVLGSFFVFASLLGYRHLGPAATISVLIASQLIVGLGLEMARQDGVRLQIGPVVGVVLLIVGAVLVVYRPR